MNGYYVFGPGVCGEDGRIANELLRKETWAVSPGELLIFTADRTQLPRIQPGGLPAEQGALACSKVVAQRAASAQAFEDGRERGCGLGPQGALLNACS